MPADRDLIDSVKLELDGRPTMPRATSRWWHYALFVTFLGVFYAAIRVSLFLLDY